MNNLKHPWNISIAGTVRYSRKRFFRLLKCCSHEEIMFLKDPKMVLWHRFEILLKSEGSKEFLVQE